LIRGEAVQDFDNIIWLAEKEKIDSVVMLAVRVD